MITRIKEIYSKLTSFGRNISQNICTSKMQFFNERKIKIGQIFPEMRNFY